MAMYYHCKVIMNAVKLKYIASINIEKCSGISEEIKVGHWNSLTAGCCQFEFIR